MTQDELKAMAARAAVEHIPAGEIIGVGTGSTVNHFIRALEPIRERIAGAVSSSQASTAMLQTLGIRVVDAREVNTLAVYIDGADEIDPHGCMIKGGGGALTREKIIASMARQFICIVDQGKHVQTLGRFPLPVEVVPIASGHIATRFPELGGTASLRLGNGEPFVTENGMHILDVSGLRIDNPLEFETLVNQWPGVVTVGVFARQKAHLCLSGTPEGAKLTRYCGDNG